MKTDVEIYTEALVKVIHDSREYKNYEEVKGKLKGEPELMKQINKFRMDTYALQNFNDGDQLYEKMEKHYEETSQFRENPLVEEYLSSELALCRMYQKIFRKIVGAVDLQLDDVDNVFLFRGDGKQ